MRIAWFTPFSRSSAIGAYSGASVRALNARADVEVVVFASDVFQREDTWLPECKMELLAELTPQQAATRSDDFDIAVYNMGNYPPFHERIYEVAMIRPGVTILHDVVMHHFFWGYWLESRHDPCSYAAEVEYSHGARGRNLANSIVQGYGGDALNSPLILEYNMAKSALRGSYGVIVHSEYARRALEPEISCPISVVNFNGFGLCVQLANRKPQQLPFRANRVRLLTYGMINPNKMVAEIISVIGESSFLRDHVVYSVLGQSTPHYADQLQDLVKSQRLVDTVELRLTRQTDESLFDYLHAADIVINIRNPHMGETSGVVMEASMAGKPIVVWKHGYYDEIPDDIVAKVDSLKTLKRRLDRLCRDHNARAEMGSRAKHFAEGYYDTDLHCDRVIAALQAARYDKPAVDLADRAGQVLGQIGCKVSDHAVRFATSHISEFVGAA